MKKIKRKTMWSICIAATLFMASSAHAISVPGTANLFRGGSDLGTGLSVSSWTPGSAPVLLGSWAPGTPLQVTAKGTTYYSIGASWGNGPSTPNGYEPSNPTTHHNPVVWDGNSAINGGAGFYTGTLVGIWSSTNDPLALTPIGGIFKLGTLANLTAQSGYLFAGIADAGWDDNGGVYNVTVTPVPLPASLWLMGSGLLGLLGYRRFRQGGAAGGEEAAA